MLPHALQMEEDLLCCDAPIQGDDHSLEDGSPKADGSSMLLRVLLPEEVRPEKEGRVTGSRSAMISSTGPAGSNDFVETA